jgi:proteic killer suppression protein
MIKSFANKETAAVFAGVAVKGWAPTLQSRARRRLVTLDHAASLGDVRCMPSNRLEKLKGNRKGQWSLRVNRQWRICFVWRDGHAWNVELVDYHQEVIMTISRESVERMDFGDIASGERLAPVRPGDILKEDFLEPLGLSPNALALYLHVPPSRITEIVNRKKPRPITPDTAARLATFFGNSPDFWLGIQAAHDLETQPDWDRIRRVVRPYKQVVNG